MSRYPRNIWAILSICVSAHTVVAGPPTWPGDCNLDWSVDLTDFVAFHACMSGPGGGESSGCGCFDTDADIDIDLCDFAVFQHSFTGTQWLSVVIASDDADGTEVNDLEWHPDGYQGSGNNRMGASVAESYDTALRFDLEEVQQGETFVYARLVVPATGDGVIELESEVRIVGIDADAPSDFSLVRPSQQPKTTPRQKR